MQSKPATIWSPYDRSRIRAELDHAISDATILRIAQGAGSEYSRIRVFAAAESLGLPLPTGTPE